MAVEFEALISNKTWKLCPRPSQQYVVRNRWVYKIKQRANSSIADSKLVWLLKALSSIVE
jgi:hypothetical protein